MGGFLYENHRGCPTVTSLNVLGVLGKLGVLDVLNMHRWPVGPCFFPLFFLDASSHLYKRPFPSVGRLVGWSVGR